MRKMQDKIQKRLGDENKEGSSSSAGQHHHQPTSCPPFPINVPDEPRPIIPQPGQQPPGPGQLPPRVSKLTYLDPHVFYHPSGRPHNVMRDLGFTGVLDGKVIWTWGDTLMGTKDSAMICAVDSTSIGSMRVPMSSMDTALAGDSNNVRNLIPLNREEERNGGYAVFSFGGTNILEPAPNAGLVYYLKMHRPGGVYTCHGAGVATITVGPDSIPHATRHHDTLWTATEPCWGDVGVAYNAAEHTVYAYGHGASYDPELSSRTFLAKVPADKALERDAYQYWNNGTRSWSSQRPGKPGQQGTVECTKEMAIFDWHAMNQSAPFWSNWFNCWMLVHSSGWPESPVYVRTAERLEGPWVEHGEVASTEARGKEGGGVGGGFRYCVVGHPEFDSSGKTVLVTWTRENVIYGVRVEWE